MSAPSALFDQLGPKGKRNVLITNIVGALIGIAIMAIVVLQFADKGQLEGRLWSAALDGRAWQFYYLPGLQNTLVAAAYSVVLALVFGLLFGVGRLASNAVVRWLCGAVVEFFRAVPVLIMMIAGWLIIARSGLVAPEDSPLIAVVAALTLYNGSVIAELIRSGVYGLPKGQRESALAIGMTRGQSIRTVELPQAIIAMLPSLVSQFVVILKDSALGAIITYRELLESARLLGRGSPFPMLQTLLIAAVLFILINYLLTRAAEFAARKVGARTSGKAKAAAPAAAIGASADTEPKAASRQAGGDPGGT